MDVDKPKTESLDLPTAERIALGHFNVTDAKLKKRIHKKLMGEIVDTDMVMTEGDFRKQLEKAKNVWRWLDR